MHTLFYTSYVYIYIYTLVYHHPTTSTTTVTLAIPTTNTIIIPSAALLLLLSPLPLFIPISLTLAITITLTHPITQAQAPILAVLAPPLLLAGWPAISIQVIANIYYTMRHDMVCRLASGQASWDCFRVISRVVAQLSDASGYEGRRKVSEAPYMDICIHVYHIHIHTYTHRYNEYSIVPPSLRWTHTSGMDPCKTPASDEEAKQCARGKDTATVYRV